MAGFEGEVLFGEISRSVHEVAVEAVEQMHHSSEELARAYGQAALFDVDVTTGSIYIPEELV